MAEVKADGGPLAVRMEKKKTSQIFFWAKMGLNHSSFVCTCGGRRGDW